MHERREMLKSELQRAEEGSRRHEIRQAIESIDQLLDDKEATAKELFGQTGDAQIDKFLKELEQDKIPDLNAGIPEKYLRGKNNG